MYLALLPFVLIILIFVLFISAYICILAFYSNWDHEYRTELPLWFLHINSSIISSFIQTGKFASKHVFNLLLTWIGGNYLHKFKESGIISDFTWQQALMKAIDGRVVKTAAHVGQSRDALWCNRFFVYLKKFYI